MDIGGSFPRIDCELVELYLHLHIPHDVHRDSCTLVLHLLGIMDIETFLEV